MRGHADANQGASGGDVVGDLWSPRQQQGERPGPEGGDERLGLLRNDGDIVEHGAIADVDDNGIPVGPFFGSEDASYSIGVEGVGSEAVDGFGGEGYGASVAKNCGGVGDAFLCCGEALGWP